MNQQQLEFAATALVVVVAIRAYFDLVESGFFELPRVVIEPHDPVDLKWLQ